jgi:drug/metabolite transporter (DMT)-like permease
MFALGLGAGLLSPFMMTIGFIVWDKSWIGSAATLNIYKCSIGSMLFLFTIATLGHSRLHTFVSANAGMLMLSSFLGIVIGDNLWLKALKLMGARRVILVDSIKPFLASIFGWWILNETISAFGYLGMVVTIAGVLIVSLEGEPEAPIPPEEGSISSSDRASSGCNDEDIEMLSPTAACEAKPVSMPSSPKPIDVVRSHTSEIRLGYALAAVNTLFDAYGAVITKQYGSVFNLWEINLIRFGFAAISMSGAAAAMRTIDKCRETKPMDYIFRNKQDTVTSVAFELVRQTDDDTPDVISISVTGEDCGERVDETRWYVFPDMSLRQYLVVALGVVFVTYMCPSLFNFSLFNLSLGLCLTVTSMGPIMSIPLVYIMKGERTSVSGLGGSVLAVTGVAILCLTEGNNGDASGV